MSYHLSKEDTNESLPVGEEVDARAEPEDVVEDQMRPAEIESGSTSDKDVTPEKGGCWSSFTRIFAKNSFVINILLAIILAYAYPPLGAVYLRPRITSNWIAVVFIFVLSGVKLKSEEFKHAFESVGFNIFVQAFNFFVVSAIVFGVAQLLYKFNAIDEAIADGMVICSCLPVSINAIMVLAQSSNGDEASAVFNSAVGNMLGIVVTPALILAYIGVEGELDMRQVLCKLGLRVVLPIVIGQLLRKTSQSVVDFVSAHGSKFTTIQELCLVYIVYTVFCKTFLSESNATAMDAVLMIAILFGLMISLMVIAWIALMYLFPNDPRLRVTGLFACTHKTVAMGVPLINAIYEHNNNVGLYTLPLLVWHPMQILIGTFVAPYLANFVEGEERRLVCKKMGLTEAEYASPDYSPQVGKSPLV